MSQYYPVDPASLPEDVYIVNDGGRLRLALCTNEQPMPVLTVNWGGPQPPTKPAVNAGEGETPMPVLAVDWRRMG